MSEDILQKLGIDSKEFIFYKNYESIKYIHNSKDNPANDPLYFDLLDTIKNGNEYMILDSVTDFYNKCKFCDYSIIIKLLKDAGFEDDLFLPNDFVNLEELERISLDIFEQGYKFSFQMLLNYFSTQLETNVMSKKINKYFKKGDIINYEKDRQLWPGQLEIEKVFRRIKYQSKQKPLDAFAEVIKLMSDTYDRMFLLMDEEIIGRVRFANQIRQYFNNVQVSMKLMGRIFFITVEEANSLAGLPKTRREILFAFEPIFRLLFESRKSGLYTKADFEKNSRMVYDDYYYKYYLSRLKVLTGY